MEDAGRDGSPGACSPGEGRMPMGGQLNRTPETDAGGANPTQVDGSVTDTTTKLPQNMRNITVRVRSPGAPQGVAVIGRLASRRPRDGAEEGLPSSQDSRLTVPRPLTPEGPSVPAPGTQAPSVAFTLAERARLPLPRLRRVAL